MAEATVGRAKDKKIVSLDELAKVVADLKKKKKIVVQSHGVFDLLHPGHFLHFEAAKKEGDVLVVTLTRDQHVNKGPGRPVFNERLRAESIASLEVVDFVALVDAPDAVNAIRTIKPDIYCKGSDSESSKEDITGAVGREQEAVESAGGRIHFTHELQFSSSELLNRHFVSYPDQAKEYLNAFRKKFTASKVTDTLRSFGKMKVLVVGETIIDEYHYSAPLGKSAKENMVVYKYSREELFAGGALACANHVSGFVGEVHLLTCLGKTDSREDFIRSALRPRVKPTFVYRPDGPTIVKRRFVWEAFLVKLFEIVFIEERLIPEETEKQAMKFLEKNLRKYDLVIVTDYGHGLFTPAMISYITKNSKFLALNVQTNSANAGFNLITKYPSADYVCIDEPEMRLAYHDKFSDLKKMVLKAAKKMQCKTFIVTRGHKGNLAYSKKDGFAETPIFSKEIVDRIGAGDAFLAVTAPVVAKGGSAGLVGFIGNAVGALAVRIVGNRTPVEPVPLFKFITALLK